MRGEIGVEIHNSAETRGRVEETSRSKIQARDVELGVERSERGVLLIDGTECSVEFELAAAGQIRGDGNGKFGGDGNIGCRDVHVVIGTWLLRIRGAYDDPSVAQREFLDGYFSSVCCAGRLFSGRFLGLSFRGFTTERRIIPHAGSVVQQSHLGTGNGDAGYGEG